MSTQTISLTDSNNNKLLPESAESGSGYAKFADGTLICWGVAAFGVAEIGHQVVNIVFPITYISNPKVIVSWNDNMSSLYSYINNLGVRRTYTTGADIQAERIRSEYVWNANYIAIGRWK